MQFAMIDNQRSPAAPGLIGQCPGCAKVVIAKCGTQRDWHWAHKGQRMCDPWWEPETPWHRAWKNYFPTEWQEVIQHDEASGEKHIADVRTAHGVVIEFQHSHLNPAERLAREKFHGNMVWVVDGKRLKRDRPRFLGGSHHYMPTPLPGVSAVHYPEDMFPKDWLHSQVLVLFDFGIDSHDGQDSMLWGLFPGRVDGKALVGPLPRSKFITLTLERPQILDAHGIVAVLTEHNRLSRENAAREAAAYAKRVRFYRYQRRTGRSRF